MSFSINKEKLYKKLKQVEKEMDSDFITNEEYVALREIRKDIIEKLLSEEE